MRSAKNDPQTCLCEFTHRYEQVECICQQVHIHSQTVILHVYMCKQVREGLIFIMFISKTTLFYSQGSSGKLKGNDNVIIHLSTL